MSADIQEKPATVKRRVSALMATYHAIITDVAGNNVATIKTADRGEEIELVKSEEDRLDGLGALAEPGKSADETQAEADARLDAYRAARGDQSAVARAVERAVAPSPGQTEPVQPPDTVSPPGIGAEPRGDYTKGDRGAEDIIPVGDTLSDGGIVRLDAPDVATATVSEIADWISAEGPTVDETVALGEGDPDLSAKVLEAEGVATGGSPRKGVESKLGE